MFPTSEFVHAVADVIPNPVVSAIGHKVADLVDEGQDGDIILKDEDEHGIRIMAETRAFYHGK
jgi:hypothetical protein